MPVDSFNCHYCGLTLDQKWGIKSYLSDQTNDKNEGCDVNIELLANRLDNDSIRDSAKEVLEENHTCSNFSELYDVRRCEWRVLVEQYIDGRCLDLYAGFGTRSMLLAELVDSVFAVDPNISKLRVLSSRDDYESAEDVTPIHTSEGRLPFVRNAFDTIVCDFSGMVINNLEKRLSELRKYLDQNGTIILILDGWSRKLNSPEYLKSGAELFSYLDFLLSASANQYQSSIRSVGFNHVDTYALFPTSNKLRYVFDVDSEEQVEKLTGLLLSDNMRYRKIASLAVSYSNKLNLLENCFPSYLIVCSNEQIQSSFDFTKPLLISGRTRSVVLDLNSDELQHVWKIPNRKSHAPFTNQEHRIISALRSENNPMVDMFPEGIRFETRFGSSRRENPVKGKPLDDLLERDEDSLSKVLQTGFEWLIEFQNSFKSNRIQKSPEEVYNDLEFKPTGVIPPQIDEPVKTFLTPVHGDYLPKNIYHSGGNVTKIIDWEYGSLEGSPIIDAGFFVLYVSKWLFQDFRKGYARILLDKNEYARIVEDYINYYCKMVGIPRRTFDIYLAAALIHRLEIDWKLDAVSTYNGKMEERSKQAKLVIRMML